MHEIVALCIFGIFMSFGADGHMARMKKVVDNDYRQSVTSHNTITCTEHFLPFGMVYKIVKPELCNPDQQLKHLNIKMFTSC